MIGNGFIRRQSGEVVYYSCQAFEKLPWLHHGFSTRIGGGAGLNLTPLAWDSPERVSENRRKLLSALGLSSCPLATLSQIHSDTIQLFSVGDTDLCRGRQGDALAAREGGIALGVQVADCFPVLLVDPGTGSIAAIHAGWRGTARRIIRKTIAKIEAAWGVRAASLLVAVGPGIRACCMQVGSEVAECYEREYPDTGVAWPQAGHDGKFLLDLPGTLALQCAEAGVPHENLFDLNLCTRCRTDDFYSYRAEGAAAGRMMAIIARD
jgi:hypothetical protein